ncbi:MAG: nucleoside-diphosphate sugar epimerase/dehydratase, partial [Smithella sp.]|nr:nucleoside-diphosphate sugar epimerase/dehydratase [Smithella sp.]
MINVHPQLKNPKFYFMILTDAAFFALAIVIAYGFRFEFSLSPERIQQIKSLIVWVVPLKLILFLASGLYRGMWRYTGIHDFWLLARTTVLSTLLIVSVILYMTRFEGYSRAVFIMDGFLTFLFAGGVRMLIRTYYASYANAMKFPGFADAIHLKKILIIGAGDAGEKILREIKENYLLDYEVVGFVDDDPAKQGRSIHGVRVLGNIQRIDKIVSKKDVQEMLIAIPSASGDQLRKIVEGCRKCNVSYKVLPGIGELIDGKVSVKMLRDVNYEDLLGRAPVKLDITGISHYLDGKTILITGCGGSIGSEICRQIIRFHPRQLVLLDASELNLFNIQMEMEHSRSLCAYQTILGNVQDERLMNDLFDRYQPQVIFHAAAYKHVPMQEKNPWEAVFNNIIGSRVVLDVAIRQRAECFVLVSTDKAVRPANVMGASKRIAELILQSRQGDGTRLMAVRFGNVVGSSGSVIPVFRRQIEQGGPVTVTHPDVSRYFMTIPEASQLILQAAAMGKGGEIFVLKMGIPVKIADMARDLIRLSGKEPGVDIDIVYTGLREGEKLHE